jgi:predicted membrane protein
VKGYHLYSGNLGIAVVLNNSFIYSSAFTIYGAGYYSSSLFEPINTVVVGGDVSLAQAND